jgi:hypothetical protein
VSSVKDRLKAFLRDHIGEVVTNEQLMEVAAPATEWARRVRELRSDEGWPIVSHNDDSSLRPGEYKLAGEPPEPGEYRFSRPISAALRAQVLERNGYTCQMCGVGAGEPDAVDPTRKVRLHIGHIVDRSHGGASTLTNLRALCSTCNQGAKDLVQEPPSWTWLLGRVRVASVNDQRKLLDWLRGKFGE